MLYALYIVFSYEQRAIKFVVQLHQKFNIIFFSYFYFIFCLKPVILDSYCRRHELYALAEITLKMTCH